MSLRANEHSSHIDARTKYFISGLKAGVAIVGSFMLLRTALVFFKLAKEKGTCSAMNEISSKYVHYICFPDLNSIEDTGTGLACTCAVTTLAYLPYYLGKKLLTRENNQKQIQDAIHKEEEQYKKLEEQYKKLEEMLLKINEEKKYIIEKVAMILRKNKIEYPGDPQRVIAIRESLDLSSLSAENKELIDRLAAEVDKLAQRRDKLKEEHYETKKQIDEFKHNTR